MIFSMWALTVPLFSLLRLLRDQSMHSCSILKIGFEYFFDFELCLTLNVLLIFAPLL